MPARVLIGFCRTLRNHFTTHPEFRTLYHKMRELSSYFIVLPKAFADEAEGTQFLFKLDSFMYEDEEYLLTVPRGIPNVRVVSDMSLRARLQYAIYQALYSGNTSQIAAFDVMKLRRNDVRTHVASSLRSCTSQIFTRYPITSLRVLHALTSVVTYACSNCNTRLYNPLTDTLSIGRWSNLDSLQRSVTTYTSYLEPTVQCDGCMAKTTCVSCFTRFSSQRKQCARCKRCTGCCCCGWCPCRKKIYATNKSCYTCGKCKAHNVCKCRFPGQLSVERLKDVDIAFEYEFGVKLDSIGRSQRPSTDAVLNYMVHGNTMTDISCPAGFEYLSGPVSLNTGIKRVKALHQWCKDRRYTEVNNHTGYHVHVNSVDVDMFQLRRIFLAWVRFEKQIYKHFMHPDRWNNTYSTPISQLRDINVFTDVLKNAKTLQQLRKYFMMFLYTNQSLANFELGNIGTNPTELNHFFKTIKRFETHKYGAGRDLQRPMNYDYSRETGIKTMYARYSSFNLHSFFYRGTLEFRCKEIAYNNDYPSLEEWTLFCYNFIKFFAKTSDRRIIKNFDELLYLLTEKELV